MGRHKKNFVAPVDEQELPKKPKRAYSTEEAEYPLQKQFFQDVKRIVPSASLDIIEVMTRLFDVSIDSAYRRARGQSALSLDEAIALCKHYNMPLSSLLHLKEDGLVFDYHILNSVDAFKRYLQGLLSALEKVGKEQGQLLYAADDVPIFYHFKHKEHAAFKIYTWLRSVLRLAEFEDAYFDVSIIPADLLELAMELYNSYTKVNSTEIWTSRSADATIAQITGYWEMGLLRSKQQAQQIITQFVDIIRESQRMTYRGEKGTGATYKLYESAEPAGTNYVLAKAKDEEFCYIRVQSFNTIVTQNEIFCRDAEMFLDLHMSSSTLIGGTNDLLRLKFFNNIILKLEATANTIKDDNRWGDQQKNF